MEVVKGKIIDILNKEIFNGEIFINAGKIDRIVKSDHEYPTYILPGFIDAHIHIESSMVVPYEFARTALLHGTGATVSDPHEIANVCGLEGIEFMMHNAEHAGLQFFFGAPSCVPATPFETSGAVIDVDDIEYLMSKKEILYLSEMMNYPGVLSENKEVLSKIEIAKKYGKPIDGHAPGLSGEQAIKYIAQGCSTDHECTTLEEASWKLTHGMKILIREGSAAKNFAALEPLISLYPDQIMFCSDDKHPDDLMKGHINEMVKRALQSHELFDVLKIVCINPILHYNLPVGYLRAGDSADFIMVKDLENWEVMSNYIKGINYIQDGHCILESKIHTPINTFNIDIQYLFDLPDLVLEDKTQIIKAINGSLLTESTHRNECNPNEILKICVVNRYQKSPIKAAFITGFGPLNGALASSVAHDSHNIVAVGNNDHDLLNAINVVVQNKGGLSFASGKEVKSLALPVAGLMHTLSVNEVGLAYQELDHLAKIFGSTLSAPYMTLSFMALLVIPKLKMSDLGLFDAEKFVFV